MDNETNFIERVSHIEMYVANLFQTTYLYTKAFGFVIIGKQNVEDYVSVLLKQSDVYIILTSSTNSKSFISEQINLHGDFIKDIGFEVKKLESIFSHATLNGFKQIAPIERIDFQGNKLIKAVIGTFGNTQHTLIERIDCKKEFFLPGYPPVPSVVTSKQEVNLTHIDHIAVALEDINIWEKAYKDGLYLKRSYQEVIETQYSGMSTIAMTSPNNSFKLVLTEAKKGLKISQIEKFITYNNFSGGIQHLAFSTPDIIKTISLLKQNHIEFLSTPSNYYDNLSEDIKSHFQSCFSQIQDLEIMIDKDENGYLLQIFTIFLQTRPTFFLEIIQRENATSFGRNNILTLFRALEQQFK